MTAQESWDLIRAGVNPLEGGQLIGGLGATTTKQVILHTHFSRSTHTQAH